MYYTPRPGLDIHFGSGTRDIILTLLLCARERGHSDAVNVSLICLYLLYVQYDILTYVLQNPGKYSNSPVGLDVTEGVVR